MSDPTTMEEDANDASTIKGEPSEDEEDLFKSDDEPEPEPEPQPEPQAVPQPEQQPEPQPESQPEPQSVPQPVPQPPTEKVEEQHQQEAPPPPPAVPAPPPPAKPVEAPAPPVPAKPVDAAASKQTQASPKPQTGDKKPSGVDMPIARKPQPPPPMQGTIQRKQNQKPALPFTANGGGTTLKPSGLDPAKFGLKAGVLIPVSVTTTLLQGRLLDTLRGLPVQLINDALAEYDDAVQIKGDAIRNHGAYLYGVIKRYVSVQERAAAGEGKGILPMGPELTPAVNARLHKLVQDKFCSEEEMNEKVKSKIRMLSEKDALFAIEELASVERRQIRNFGSYFMGILNRYMRGDTGNWQKKQEMHKRQNRFDDRRRDDNFQRHEPEFRRGRDNFDRHDSYRRERSRDRFDHDKRDGHGHRDWRDQYDPRQQKHPFHGPGHHQQPLGGIPGNPPPPPPRTNPAGMLGSNPYSHLQSPAGPQHQMYPPPGSMDQSQFVPQAAGAPPPSSVYGHQPGSQHLNSRSPGMGGQQSQPYSQQVVQSPYGNAQPGMGVSQPMRGKPAGPDSYGVSMNQNPMMGQQPQHFNSSVGPPNSQGRFAPPPNQGPAGWQPQPGTVHNSAGQAPVDILGLADKAASAVQALQNQGRLQQQNVRQQGQPPYGGPPGHSIPPHGMGQPSHPPQNYHANVPQQQQQQQPPPPYGPQGQRNSIGGGGPGSVAGANGGAAGLAAANANRRRTTASMTELPVTVQYAVQNLQATGQIDGSLDDGMLGMIKDLPENLALQALQKFSSIDKNTMRNKTAYLAGVLRRELEKINRR